MAGSANGDNVFGSFMDNIFGTSGNSSGNTTAAETTSGTQTQNSTTKSDVMSKIIEALSGKSDTIKGTAENAQRINNLVSTLSSKLGEFGKSNAITDSADAVRSAIADTLNGELGKILGVGTATGTIGSSGVKNLTETLTAKAAGVGAKLQQDVVGQYADIQLKGGQLFSNLLKVQQDANTATVDSQNKESATTGTKTDTTDSTTNLTAKKNSSTDVQAENSSGGLLNAIGDLFS